MSKYTIVTGDLQVKKTKEWQINAGESSVSLTFNNVIAASVNTWEASQIEAEIRLKSEEMDEICKTWLEWRKDK